MTNSMTAADLSQEELDKLLPTNYRGKAFDELPRGLQARAEHMMPMMPKPKVEEPDA